MKRKFLSLFIIILLGFSIPAVSSEKDLNISGRIKLFGSVFLYKNLEGNFFSHNSGDFALKRLETRVKIAGSLNDNISYNLRFDAFSNSGTLFQENRFPESGILSTPFSSEYFELNLYEANVTISDFLLENLDLTLGKQRISWGTADKVNVVDNLNPIDFANFFSFDPDYAFERRPQTALNFEYYIGESSKLQFVWLLQHQIAPLPYGYTLLTKTAMDIREVKIEKDWHNNIKGSNYALRFSTNIMNIDLGISYYRGNMDLPVLKSFTLTPFPAGEFFYGREKIAGFDLSTVISGATIWGELAYIMPDEAYGFIQIPIVMNNNIVGVQNVNFRLFEKGFFKYVVGGDYNFSHGFYLNIQFLHGFFDEYDYTKDAETYFRKKKGEFFGELSNYIIPALEHKFHNDDYKIRVAGIVEISDKTAYILTPQIDLRISDGLMMTAGGFFVISGDENNTKFGPFKEDKLFYLGLKIDF